MRRNRIFGSGLAPLYCNDGGDGGDGGTGGGGSSTGFSAEQQAAVDAAVEAATSGLKSKNSELLGTTKQMQSQLKAWEGLDPAQVRGFMEKLGADEELKLIAEGKHEAAWGKRLEKVGATHRAQLDAVAAERDTLKTERETLAQQVRDLIIDQQVVTNFVSEKGFEGAIPDVVLRAKAAFKIEEGVPIARDSNGEIIRGASGPITVKEWVAARKLDCPHWFPGSQGAGASGSGGGRGGSDIWARMEAAADAGDMATYRKLSDERKKAAK